MPGPLRFSLQRVDPGSEARAGLLQTLHGVVETPAFMPVGTQATVKGILPDQLRALGSRILLANTYHLALRPGPEIVAELGGLHHFMNWDGPILTDSGGFQVFSLADRAQLSESGVTFRSHLDGSLLDLTPEHAISIQESLGADIAMVLDHCPALPSSKELIADATERTIRWALRCREARSNPDQAVFGIVQGGPHPDLRASCAEALVAMEFDGYAVGGVSVGESPDEIRVALKITTPHLPVDQIRYLMGVGRPQDVLDAIDAGIDIFDCVLPTRNGRNATCLTRTGQVRLRNASYKTDRGPIEEGCGCVACTQFSRAYLRHLFLANEMLGPILASIHNLWFLHQMIREAREAILRGEFVPFRLAMLEALGP